MSYSQKKPIHYEELPDTVRNYLYYRESVQGSSQLSIAETSKDLLTFFRYLYKTKKLVSDEIKFDDIDVRNADIEFVKKITKIDILEYMHYLTADRGNKPATRARRLSSIKTYYTYLCSKVMLLSNNPTDGIDSPSLRKKQPVYLTLEEALQLLSDVKTDFTTRDYCMITLFLNCGMRLSELVGIDIRDIGDDTIKILGKGNKERTVYLNAACKSAMSIYMKERAALKNLNDTALFVSARTGKRLTPRRVEQIMEKCFSLAGLSNRGFTPHKLRHTAATLMYQSGAADMLALKEILGHEHVSTTEIYTHISVEKLAQAVNNSPLAGVKANKKAKEKHD